MSALFPEALNARIASPAITGRRRAALLLHGMSLEDRAWALDRLSEVERGELAPLLGELEAMGVPAKASWVRGALQDNRATSIAPVDTPRQRIASASAEHVLAALACEPPALVRRVLALGPWPWQAALCRAWAQRLPNACEPAIAGPQAVLTEAPLRAVDQALLEGLATRLGEGGDHRPAMTESIGLAALWPRFRVLLQSMTGRTR